MKAILAKPNQSILEQMAWSNVLVAFDYDGTLAPIVDDREKAEMRAITKTLLAQVCQRYPCAIISGRSKTDVASKVEGFCVQAIVGNHGLEPGTNLEHFEREIANTVPKLKERLANEPGVEIENKRYSLAIHYRASRQKKRARLNIRKAISEVADTMRVVAGKLVINLVPHGASDKGTALLRLMQEQGCDTAIYLGDDVTDEDVFTYDLPGRLLSIRVGHSKRSAAPYYLRNQVEIDALLAVLLHLRPLNPDETR